VSRLRLARDTDQTAPHVIDAEVLGIVGRDPMLRRLDRTTASQAVEDLCLWPGERFGHRALLPRVCDLRDRARSWDALCVALAEALGGTLVVLDARLARLDGLECQIDGVGEG
jgi:predicted nucleic acid-binding protein